MSGWIQATMQQNIICGGFLKFEAQCAGATGTAAPATWAGAASPAPTTTGRWTATTATADYSEKAKREASEEAVVEVFQHPFD